jgi:hypothetical protein
MRLRQQVARKLPDDEEQQQDSPEDFRRHQEPASPEGPGTEKQVFHDDWLAG